MMKLPISNRLLACAGYVRPGARVADVGCDHGYLGIYLIRNQLASFVSACDLRPLPLQKAKENADKFGTADRMEFHVADGLAAVDASMVDTVVCAGMGADCILEILEAAPWIRDPEITLILQPQTSGQALRGWLTEQGFAILRETLLEENRYLYTVLEARYTGRPEPLSPGKQYVTDQLLEENSPLLARYLMRVSNGMQKAVLGLRQGADDPEKLQYYESALAEIEEMRKTYGNGQ